MEHAGYFVMWRVGRGNSILGNKYGHYGWNMAQPKRAYMSTWQRTWKIIPCLRGVKQPRKV